MNRKKQRLPLVMFSIVFKIASVASVTETIDNFQTVKEISTEKAGLLALHQVSQRTKMPKVAFLVLFADLEKN